MKERKFNRQNAPTKGIKQSFNEEYSEQVDYEDKIPEGMTEADVKSLENLYKDAYSNYDPGTIRQEVGKPGTKEKDNLYEIVRMLNPQAARLFLSTVPKLLQGETSLTTAFGQELGLYKPRYLGFTTKDYRERKQSILSAIRYVAPKWADPYFTPKEKVDKRLKKHRKNIQLGNTKFSESVVNAIVQSLRQMKQ